MTYRSSANTWIPYRHAIREYRRLRRVTMRHAKVLFQQAGFRAKDGKYNLMWIRNAAYFDRRYNG